MFLFREPDTKRTEQNVLKFFEKDYPKLCMMAGANLKSPVLSVAPATTNKGNSQEDKFIKLINNRKILEAVQRSIKTCSASSQIILKERIIKGNELYQIMPMLNISSYGKYYKLQTIACNEFADAFEVMAEPYFEKGENDLHYYEKQES